MTFIWKKCTHETISADIKSGYCTDCGKYVENHWYITRCKCCGIRHKTLIKNNTPTPINRYCKNCGAEEYILEEIETPDIVSVNYAALLKVTQKVSAQSLVQSWIEKNTSHPCYGLLTAY